jgi:hypothetical protein
MKHVISYEMKKLAQLMVFASGLTIDKLHHIMEAIEEMLDDEKNFEPNNESALTFSKKGALAIKKIDPSLYADHLVGVLKRLDSAIRYAAVENADMKNLDQYLQKTLRRAPGKWINVVVKDKNFQDAKKAILASAINPFTFAVNNLTLTPQPNKVKEEFNPSKGMTPEEYKKLMEKEEHPIGPGEDFDPMKRPQSLKPEKTLERKS